MSVSTDGQICFGIMFDEGFVFPWGGDEYFDGIEEWWMQVNGYKPPFEIYTADGEYINNKQPSPAQTSEYFKHRRIWGKENPLPVIEVNYCSCDVPMIILAIPTSVYKSSRGYPVALDFDALEVTMEQVKQLLVFCREQGIDTNCEEPKWWLSSYWG